jgi:hypothetical protein
MNAGTERLLFFLAASTLVLGGLTFSLRGSAVAQELTADSKAQVNDASTTLRGNPSNYLALLGQLHAGDTLLLEPGVYRRTQKGTGLPIFNLHGAADKRIVISGPERGPRPVFYASEGTNTIRIADSSYVTIRNLDLDGQDLDVDGVKAQGVSDHITVENLYIRNHGNNQQTVAISTKATAWDWVIRENVIVGAGTGIYLGDSDGSQPFVHGVIEYNLILDTIGYNIEITHQVYRPDLPGLPTTPGATIIRHNVLSKAEHGAVGSLSRPNTLVGHFPLVGPGSEDIYEIYGNLFYQNPTGQPLFQGEGNLAVYDNLFWNDSGDAVLIRPHNAFPRKVMVFSNTVFAQGVGIKVVGGSDRYRQRVIGNLTFAIRPVLANDQMGNVTGLPELAGSYLRHPAGPLGELDLSPLPGKLPKSNLPMSLFASYDDALLDFEGARRSVTFVGAYDLRPTSPHWLPHLERKPPPSLLSQ